VLGGYPITKASLAFKNQEAIGKSFLPIKIDERNFNEENNLIELSESALPTMLSQSVKLRKEEADLEW
jgi:hypothetical protein